MVHIVVDDLTYDTKDLAALREELIGYRDESLNQWPEAIQFTVSMTHVVAILSVMIDHMELCPEGRLEAVIERHTSPTGEHPVSVQELRNVARPGSTPMLPERPGHGATCSICCPEGQPASSAEDEAT